MTTFMKCHLATLLLAAALALPALAQQPSPLPIPSQLEKELAAHASDVTEVTLNKNMLAFAAKFMHDKGEDDAHVRELIEGLDGIYVRDYEFDKEGEYPVEQVEQLRKAFAGPEWTPIIHEHERRSGETTDIMVKAVNGENKGMFILNAEPRELSVVLILGPIRMEDLGKLHGIAGLGDLSSVGRDQADRMRDKARDERDRARDKDRDKGKNKDKNHDKGEVNQ